MVAAIAAASVNYLLSLALIRVLAPPELARYVGLAGAALVVGSALGAGLPAAIGVAHARGEHAGADRFAARAALFAGAIALPLVAGYGFLLAGAPGALAMAAAGVVVVASTVSTGRLVGLELRRRLAVGRMFEAGIRLVVGVIGGILGGAPGAIVGIVAGTGAFAAIGLSVRTPDRGDAPGRRLAVDALVLTLVFALSAAAGSLDVLVLPLLLGTTPELGAYAGTAVVARAPYFAAAALAGAFYAPLAARRLPEEASEAVRSAVLVALPGALLVASLPKELVDLVVPNAWALGPRLLAALALAGFGAAVFAVGTALTAATGRRVLALAIAVVAVIIGGSLLMLTARTSLALAAASLGLTTLSAGTIGLLSYAPWRAAILRRAASVVPVAAVAALPLAVEPIVGRIEWLWIAATAVTGVLILDRLIRHRA